MKIKKIFKRIRHDYVVNQVKKANVPPFGADETVRYCIIFEGRVQGVGFRLEMEQLARRLNLTGWAKNLENGGVEAQIQGMKNRIDFLLGFMNSLVRIKIDKMQKEAMDVLPHEQGFLVL